MIAGTGWSWEYIDRFMTLPRFAALHQYWRNHPPAHVLLKVLTGFKGEETSESLKRRHDYTEDIGAIAREMGGNVNKSPIPKHYLADDGYKWPTRY